MATTVHFVITLDGIGLNGRWVGTHKHECTCGWRSVEHTGRATDCGPIACPTGLEEVRLSPNQGHSHSLSLPCYTRCPQWGVEDCRAWLAKASSR